MCIGAAGHLGMALVLKGSFATTGWRGNKMSLKYEPPSQPTYHGLFPKGKK